MAAFAVVAEDLGEDGGEDVEHACLGCCAAEGGWGHGGEVYSRKSRTE